VTVHPDYLSSFNVPRKYPDSDDPFQLCRPEANNMMTFSSKRLKRNKQTNNKTTRSDRIPSQLFDPKTQLFSAILHLWSLESQNYIIWFYSLWWMI